MPPPIQVWTLVSFAALFVITLLLLHLLGRINNAASNGILNLSEKMDARFGEIEAKQKHDALVIAKHESQFADYLDLLKTVRDMTVRDILSTHSASATLAGNRINTLEKQLQTLVTSNAEWDDKLKSSQLDKDGFLKQVIQKVTEFFDQKMQEINQRPEDVVGPVLMHKFLNTPDLGANDAVTLADLKNFIFKRERGTTSLELPITTAIKSSDAIVKAVDDESTIIVGSHALTPAQAVLVANLIYEWINTGRIAPGRSAGDADPTLHPNQPAHPDLQRDLAAVQSREAEEAEEKEDEDDEEDDEDEDDTDTDGDGIEKENDEDDVPGSGDQTPPRVRDVSGWGW